MTSLRRTAPIAVITALALTLTACAGGGSSLSSKPVSGGTLIFAQQEEPTCLDPVVSGNMAGATLGLQYLDSLVSQDADGTIHPWLAESWTISDDGLVYTFSLRDDVSFTDSTPFNAEAVKVNFDTIPTPDRGIGSSSAQYLQYVDHTDVVDDFTVRVTLTRPFSPFLEQLAQPFVGIQSPAAIAKGKEQNCLTPVGTGPFIVDSYKRGDRVVLKRNENYNSAPSFAKHQGPAYVDEVSWRFIPEGSTRYSAVRSGQIDASDGLSPVDENAASKDSSLEVLSHDYPGVSETLIFAQDHGPFQDEAVRKAFAYSIDVRAALDSVLFGRYERTGVLSPTTAFEAKEYRDAYNLDYTKAETLLDEAGWKKGANGIREKDGEKLSVAWAWPTVAEIPAAYQNFAEQFQASAKKAGFELTLQPLPMADYLKNVNARSAEIYWSKWTLNSADVLRLLYQEASIYPAQTGGFVLNAGHIRDAEFEKALSDAAATTDADERRAFYETAQRIYSEKAFGVGLFEQSVRIVANKSKVSGISQDPALGLVDLRDAWVAAD